MVAIVLAVVRGALLVLVLMLALAVVLVLALLPEPLLVAVVFKVVVCAFVKNIHFPYEKQQFSK
jgi:Na+/H+ antiporter NhaC